MVAISTFDLIIAVTWVGGLTLFVIGRAVASWLRFRRTSNFAVYARLLSDATRPSSEVRAEPEQADILPFPQRSPAPERSASEG